MIDEKGFDKLIKVMKLVNDKDRTIKLSIIGEGPSRRRLENLVAENNLNRFVNFYGTIEKSELIEEYLNSSLFVSCSEKESFCLSLMEAMTVGVPAVAFYEESLCDVINKDNPFVLKSDMENGTFFTRFNFNNDHVKENVYVINNDINGYLIKNGSIEDMADKILEIMNNTELRKSLGNCARETVMFYDVNTIKGDWIKII